MTRAREREREGEREGGRKKERKREGAREREVKGRGGEERPDFYAIYWTNPINPSSASTPTSTRLFSNILIYAAFTGLICRPLSFICAFRGEICPWSRGQPVNNAPPRIAFRRPLSSRLLVQRLCPPLKKLRVKEPRG